MAELDCLVAFAMCAREYKYCRPQLTTDNVLHIVNGGYKYVLHMLDTVNRDHSRLVTSFCMSA